MASYPLFPPLKSRIACNSLAMQNSTLRSLEFKCICLLSLNIYKKLTRSPFEVHFWVQIFWMEMPHNLHLIFDFLSPMVINQFSFIENCEKQSGCKEAEKVALLPNHLTLLESIWQSMWI